MTEIKHYLKSRLATDSSTIFVGWCGLSSEKQLQGERFIFCNTTAGVSCPGCMEAAALTELAKVP